MFQSKYVMVGNIRTHYLEAGQGEPLMLLHSGEYGASAENSWEYNIEVLSKHFHVYALDMVGFGGTDKLFSFDDAQGLRFNHIREFMRVMCIQEASFIGNSVGGGMILAAASQDQPILPIKKLITISGGGPINPEVFETLNNYDCSKEYMEKILDLLFYEDKWKSGEYLDKRYETSLIPGTWEAATAARLKSPAAKEKERHIPDYGKIKVPVLICAGEHDTLKFPDYAEKLQSSIPHAKVQVFKNSSHCAHIEQAEQFNEIALEFLLNN
ncbi:alpha/beta hydrolase [Cytobacillus depressus]|uniref:Alpha/beta hydrolase n=1 Tax=Cytobacillus depressus TaxID=1602942 RepID=A0A6L3V7E4_9BACI|nr:alpha/beta hydrolase [Cytobacillus depressus]KAB2336246.1 alpha/beta hydrolase [Cytobacillus depressus]